MAGANYHLPTEKRIYLIDSFYRFNFLSCRYGKERDTVKHIPSFLITNPQISLLSTNVFTNSIVKTLVQTLKDQNQEDAKCHAANTDKQSCFFLKKIF